MTAANTALCELEESKQDYQRWMVEYGFTQAIIQKFLDDASDLVPMPEVFNKTRLQGSPLQGQGLFATAPIMAGELIGPSRLNGCRTPAGRFINHSVKPNAMFVPLPSGDLDTTAIHNIEAGQELFVDYRQVGSVNGWMRPCNKAEAMETLRARLAKRNCQTITGKDLDHLAKGVLDVLGYLPVQLVDLVQSGRASQAARDIGCWRAGVEAINPDRERAFALLFNSYVRAGA